MTVPCLPCLCPSLLHCEIPFLGAISVCNNGKSRAEEFSVVLTLSDYAGKTEISVPSLDANSETTIDPPPVRMKHEKLAAVTEPITLTAQLYLQEEPTIASETRLMALGIWHWPHAQHFLKALAAYVVPHHPITEQIVMLSRSVGQDDLIQLLVSSDSRNRERKVAKLLYGILASSYDIAYEDPQLHYELDGLFSYQSIRPPHRIFSDSPDEPGIGTCLDLALLFAACLENLGLCSVVLVLGDDLSRANHALAGLWTGRIPGGRSVIHDKARILEEMEAGNILLYECTGFAACPSRKERKLPLRRAAKTAKTRLREAEWAALIDVIASRPPRGSVTPISAPEEPEATCVYEEAKLLARRAQRRTIETVNILYGLLKAGGETTAKLVGQLHLDVAALLARMEANIGTHDWREEPRPTRTFEECRRLAEQIAWADSVPSVRERDVWWALLEKREQSRKLVEMCEANRIDLDRLAAVLETIHPAPRLPVVTGALSRS